MTASIAILIPYFGEWPAWIDFFVESCRANRTVDWILFTDSEPPANRASNVRFVHTTFGEYLAQSSEALGVRLGATEPYKLCDIRPALGCIHAGVVRGYDFVGFGDIDVVYGDLRSFYDDDVLSRYDLLSSHADRVSGHFCVMRNREDIVTAFKRIRGWKNAFARPDYVNFDERAFYNLFRGRRAKLLGGLGLQRTRCLFREAYSTPAPTSSIRWFWKNGRLTSDSYPHNPFMYLHFMSWQNNRWYASQPDIDADAPAPWRLLPEIVQMDWREARANGFMISRAGIQPIGANS